MVVGLALLGIALLTALWGVARFVFGDGTALQLVIPVAAAMVRVWIVVPFTLRRRRGSTAGHGRRLRRARAGCPGVISRRLHLGLEDVAGAAGELLAGPPLVVLERGVVAVVVLLDDLERPSSVGARCDPAGRAPARRRGRRDPASRNSSIASPSVRSARAGQAVEAVEEAAGVLDDLERLGQLAERVDGQVGHAGRSLVAGDGGQRRACSSRRCCRRDLAAEIRATLVADLVRSPARREVRGRRRHRPASAPCPTCPPPPMSPPRRRRSAPAPSTPSPAAGTLISFPVLTAIGVPLGERQRHQHRRPVPGLRRRDLGRCVGRSTPPASRCARAS